MENLFEIVYEDDELLVVNKAAGLVCHPTKGDLFSSLISRVRLYLGEHGQPHMINRLDRETSGLVVVAKNENVARQLRKVWERRAVRKEYLAIVSGHVSSAQATIEAPIGADETSAIAVKGRVKQGGSPAHTGFSLLCHFTNSHGVFSLLKVHPVTGRKHQIRIHLAHHGHPVVGDKLYGGDEDLYLAFVQYRLTPEQHARLLLPNQALHAQRLEFEWRRRPYSFLAEPEESLLSFIHEDLPRRTKSVFEPVEPGAGIHA